MSIRESLDPACRARKRSFEIVEGGMRHLDELEVCLASPRVDQVIGGRL
jgi:hypothetical protein